MERRWSPKEVGWGVLQRWGVHGTINNKHSQGRNDRFGMVDGTDNTACNIHLVFIFVGLLHDRK